MAAQVLTAARLEVNGVNLSQWVRSLNLDIKRDAPEQTTMGDATKRVIAGMKDWSVTATLVQDFAANAVDDTLWGVFDAGTPVAVKIRPTQAAISATNQEYTGSAVLVSYNPVSGAVGDLHEVEVEFRPAGNLTRATA